MQQKKEGRKCDSKQERESNDCEKNVGKICDKRLEIAKMRARVWQHPVVKTKWQKAELVQTISSSPQTRKILAKKGLLKTPEEVEEMTSLCRPLRQAKLKKTELPIQHCES